MQREVRKLFHYFSYYFPISDYGPCQTLITLVIWYLYVGGWKLASFFCNESDLKKKKKKKHITC